ncbi:hypothetical protein [Streptomyces tailanensis]|uniref:hypothetical protein n=1 Tax=Streptomyces tailanensis TaxID=2569858 RepID=UPI001FE47226|nr:hypothetical protein [Streptomyces tailanensis]
MLPRRWREEGRGQVGPGHLREDPAALEPEAHQLLGDEGVAGRLDQADTVAQQRVDERSLLFRRPVRVEQIHPVAVRAEVLGQAVQLPVHLVALEPADAEEAEQTRLRRRAHQLPP